MTFGEKIQKSRKEKGLSQEELSFQLSVSRQAISKWERDSGYPETDKIVKMSKIFGVSLDYLLNEESDNDSTPQEGTGFYISREMANGYLFHQKKSFFKIALAFAVLIGGFAFSFWGSSYALVLNVCTIIATVALIVSVKLTDNPYKVINSAPLSFDKNVWDELNSDYQKKKAKFQWFIVIGVILLAFGFMVFPLLLPEEVSIIDEALLSAGMIMSAVGLFLIIYYYGCLRSYRTLFHQKEA